MNEPPSALPSSSHSAPAGAARPFDLVLAVDDAWGIGKDNGLPWPKLPADLRHFQQVTSTAPAGVRNAVIMGRRTWESREVRARPLPRRCNVVITRSPLPLPDGVRLAGSLDEALAQLTGPDIGQVFIIGGAEIYRLALAHPGCRAVYLTRVRGDYGCDTAVPDLDALCEPDPTWPAASHREHEVDFRIERLLVKPPHRRDLATPPPRT